MTLYDIFAPISLVHCIIYSIGLNAKMSNLVSGVWAWQDF